MLQLGRNPRLGLNGMLLSNRVGLTQISRFQQASFCSSALLSSSRPSTNPPTYALTPKTTVILKDIGPNTTQTSLNNLLSDAEMMPPVGTKRLGMPVRRGQVQPGFTMHVISEVEAEHIRERLAKEFKLEVSTL